MLTYFQLLNLNPAHFGTFHEVNLKFAKSKVVKNNGSPYVGLKCIHWVVSEFCHNKIILLPSEIDFNLAPQGS